ncbi:hypothetical protein QU593_03960 [Rossellomorea marisflavi]|uniref:hypothetical protein n=1 Tax=Rossellomorea marisflavi TaxID=189381 RepID=UPI0025B2442A|nr:hypothetical protein [Rossellomorea marisflavi]WJV19647.1 hypothetical protein QU593_03960 [Rossellomorea marisflavi]
MDREELFLSEFEYNNDKMYLILRGHLYIESELIKLIENYILYPEKLELKNMGFNNKCRMASSLGLIDDQMFEILILINRLRNKYAHNLEYNITKGEIDKLEHKISTFEGFEFIREKVIIGEKAGLPEDIKVCILSVRSILQLSRKSVQKKIPEFIWPRE